MRDAHPHSTTACALASKVIDSRVRLFLAHCDRSRSNWNTYHEAQTPNSRRAIQARRASGTTGQERDPGTEGGGGQAPVFSRVSQAIDRGLNNVRDVKLPAGYVVADLPGRHRRHSWPPGLVAQVGGHDVHLAQRTAIAALLAGLRRSALPVGRLSRPIIASEVTRKPVIPAGLRASTAGHLPTCHVNRSRGGNSHCDRPARIFTPP